MPENKKVCYSLQSAHTTNSTVHVSSTYRVQTRYSCNGIVLYEQSVKQLYAGCVTSVLGVWFAADTLTIYWRLDTGTDYGRRPAYNFYMKYCLHVNNCKRTHKTSRSQCTIDYQW